MANIMGSKRQPWLQEEIDFVLANYKTMKKPEISAYLCEHYTYHTVPSVKMLYHKLGLKSGIDTRIKKGNVSPFKGKHHSPETLEKMKKTMFPKGNKPHNWLPVNSEVIDSFGYLKVKIAEPNKWKHKHRLVWEKERGKIPPGMRITFLDGNPLNCNIENLVMISSGENIILNRKFKSFDTPEERQVQVDIVKINHKVRTLNK